MQPLPALLRYPAFTVFPLFIAAFSDGESPTSPTLFIAMLDVYKNLARRCCQQWVHHVEENGFDTNPHYPAVSNRTKNIYGIAPELQSCYTAVTSDDHVFEGHIPAHLVQRFLDNTADDALSLRAPGIPVGNSGVEIGDSFAPYEVWLLNLNGPAKVSASVHGRDQHQEL